MENKKFKIGDRVRVIDKVGKADLKGFTGTVIAYCPNDCHDIGVEFDERVPRNWAQHSCFGAGKEGFCRWGSESEFELIAPKNNKKIVITSDGVETLARIYEGNKVVKSATAKCSPHDEYDFETGAKIAFERLVGEEKPKYKAGDKVKVIANTCGHLAKIGDIITLTDDNVIAGCSKPGHYKEGGGYIREDDFETYTEPEYFTGKVVCVESDMHLSLTVGKVYDFSEYDGCGKSDSGYKITDNPNRDTDDLNSKFKHAKFIPFVE